MPTSNIHSSQSLPRLLRRRAKFPERRQRHQRARRLPILRILRVLSRGDGLGEPRAPLEQQDEQHRADALLVNPRVTPTRAEQIRPNWIAPINISLRSKLNFLKL